MKKIFPILLIGCLSMFFAEVLSGSSQVWFTNPISLLLPFPLYLFHVIFFLHIALRSKKISLLQLYIFGMIFALYESWITKVLWSGYPGSEGIILIKIFGVGLGEFPILVFFWHPIMSFILPILIFEIFSGTVVKEHMSLLNKTKIKTFLIIIFLLAISTFIANGNQFNILSTNFAIIGSIILILGFNYLSKNKDLKQFEFKKTGFIIILIYITLLYIFSFFLLVPEKTPLTITPYISIIFIYIIFIFMIKKTKPVKIKFVKLKSNQYSKKDFILFSIILILLANLACLIPNISLIVLFTFYAIISIIGIIIFIISIYKVFKNK